MPMSSVGGTWPGNTTSAGAFATVVSVVATGAVSATGAAVVAVVWFFLAMRKTPMLRKGGQRTARRCKPV